MGNNPASQQRLLIQLTTPLGEDALIPIHLSGTEAMGKGFEYTLHVYSETHHGLEADELVGKPVTFRLSQERDDHEEEGWRYFNVFVRSLDAGSRSGNGERSHYTLEVVPWLWFLGKTTNCRVFQNRSIPAILDSVIDDFAAVFGEGSVRADFSGLRKNHPDLEFVVQYNETDLNFVKRLAYRAGITFHCVHEDGAHEIRFVDDGNALNQLPAGNLPEEGKLLLQSNTAAHDHLHSWANNGRFATGKYTLRAYDYGQPDTDLTGEETDSGVVGSLSRASALEQYLYTESYHQRPQGAEEARRTLAQGVAGHRIISGSGSYRFLKPGEHFSVTTVPEPEDSAGWPDADKEFTFIKTTLRANAEDNSYSVSFDAVPKGELVYPTGETPVIASLQTAVVTGTKSTPETNVYTDNGQNPPMGRVKARFHWDRDHGHLHENSSCWLRVMQGMSGDGFGVDFLPRVGQEVVVAFENGNPDRPFILGALYNEKNQPPYRNEPTQSGIRTRSFDSNSPDERNELRFDDKAGSEEIYVHAQKDLKLDIRNDERRNIGNNLVTVINEDEIRDVGNLLDVTAGDEILLSVGDNQIKIDKGGITIQGGAITINGKPIKIN
ncbi:MAG: type VI secretion system tip protein VgrG [Ectothiorhodospiraceae bacterium]|nr:type VI secretion system tip protein VgrG [Ectothiorhodospiraceae bacterium]